MLAFSTYDILTMPLVGIQLQHGWIPAKTCGMT